MLWARKKIQVLSWLSKTSAVPNVTVAGRPGITDTRQVIRWVKPSISVSKDTPPSLGSLLMNKPLLLVLPELILLMRTSSPAGVSAQLVPLTRMRATSLKLSPTYSVYSSEPNTKSSNSTSKLGTTVKDSLARSKTPLPKSGSFTDEPLIWLLVLSASLGPNTLTTLPELRMTPSSKSLPRRNEKPSNSPAWALVPVKEGPETVRPGPASRLAIVVVVTEASLRGVTVSARVAPVSSNTPAANSMCSNPLAGRLEVFMIPPQYNTLICAFFLSRTCSG